MVNFFASTLDKFVTKSKGIWERYTGNVVKGFLVVAENLGMDPETSQNAIKQINEDLNNFDKTEARRLKKRIDAANELADEKMKNINKEKNATVNALDEMKEAESERIIGEKRAALEQAIADLKNVVTEWNAALGKHQTKAEAAADEAESDEEPEVIRDEHGRRIDELGQAAAVRGTFSPFALRGILSADIATRTAKAAENTADNTLKIAEGIDLVNRLMKKNEFAFGP